MALTQISTEGIKDGTITGTDLATNVDLVDNQKIRFGTGNDLEIFHNNSNQSIIKNDNSYLRILSDGVTINNNADSEAMIVAIPNGATELYHDGTKKFETHSAGVKVSAGNLYLDRDNAKVVLGASDDLEIYHDGSNSYVKNAGTGNIIFLSDDVQFKSDGGGNTGLTIDTDAGVELYYNNSKKLHTHSGGITISGSIHMDDNNKYIAGTGDDLQIYHDGSNSYLYQNGTGELRANAATFRVMDRNGGETQLLASENGAVELYYDNSKKLETTSYGIAIGGTTSVSTRLHVENSSGDAYIRCRASVNQGLLMTDSSTGNLKGFVGTGGAVNLGGNNLAITAALSGGNIVFQTNGTASSDERMRITSDGKLLIGMSSASTVTQGMMFAPGGESSIFRTSGINLLIGGGQVSQKLIEFRHDGSAIGNISKSGTTAVSYNTSNSDRTLKKNFEDWTDSYWTGFKNLKPQKFNYLFQEDSEPKLKGYIAQDLASTFPEAYPKDVETDKYMFNPSGMVTYLMKTLQEAITKIETLETEVAALKDS